MSLITKIEGKLSIHYSLFLARIKMKTMRLMNKMSLSQNQMFWLGTDSLLWQRSKATSYGRLKSSVMILHGVKLKTLSIAHS